MEFDYKNLFTSVKDKLHNTRFESDTIQWHIDLFIDCNNAGEVARILKDWAQELGEI